MKSNPSNWLRQSAIQHTSRGAAFSLPWVPDEFLRAPTRTLSPTEENRAENKT